MGSGGGPVHLAASGWPLIVVTRGAYLIVSWARRSARAKFKAMIKSVFEEVDHDHGGTVDSDELYTAVLLVYLQVNKAIRVIGAVKPPKRHSVDEVLAQYAKDTGSGKELNQDQFEDVVSCVDINQ